MRSVFPICLLALCLLAGAALGAGLPPGVTSYAAMTRQLEADAASTPDIRLTSIGQSAHGHKPLWLVRVADPAVAPGSTTRILVLCRQHGDEPAPTEAALTLLHGVAAGQNVALQGDLRQVSLYIVPMVNPDGADAMTRRNGAGVDLNRDWGVFSQPETQAVAQAAKIIRPQMVIDLHNWDGDDPYNANCIEGPRSLDTPLFRLSHGVRQAAACVMQDAGYGVNLTAYGPETDGRLAHRWFTRAGTMALLVETHSGDPKDQADFLRRQGFYLALLGGLVHHYGQGGSAARLALEQVESLWVRPTQEASLFTPRAQTSPAASTPAPTSPVSRPVWLWALCLFGLALWLGRLGGARPAPTSHAETVKARRPAFVPASKRLSAARRGTPRYRYSPSSPRVRPAPATCAHKRQIRTVQPRPARPQGVSITAKW